SSSMTETEAGLSCTETSVLVPTTVIVSSQVTPSCACAVSRVRGAAETRRAKAVALRMDWLEGCCTSWLATMAVWFMIPILRLDRAVETPRRRRDGLLDRGLPGLPFSSYCACESCFWVEVTQ